MIIIIHYPVLIPVLGHVLDWKVQRVRSQFCGCKFGIYKVCICSRNSNWVNVGVYLYSNKFAEKLNLENRWSKLALEKTLGEVLYVCIWLSSIILCFFHRKLYLTILWHLTIGGLERSERHVSCMDFFHAIVFIFYWHHTIY